MALQMIQGIVPLILLMIGIRFIGRRLFRRKKVAPGAERCKCGYVLENLAVARCPECGRVFGFDATAEQLGLTDDQLHRVQAARQRRKNERAS